MLSRVTAAQAGLALVLFAALWSALLWNTSLTPPQDSIEQWVWVNSLQWGYYKHPPLPTWLLWLPDRASGHSVATLVLMGAATTGAALALLWNLLRRARGTAYACVAVLAAACITYYNVRLNYYNHNVVLLLASTACAWALERALATKQRRWWLGVGLALGLGALAKYQVVMTVACVAVTVILTGTWRDAAQRRGMGLAAGLALLVVLPHAIWLVNQRDGPIAYAMHSSLGARLDAAARTGLTLQWLADQVLNRALPALLLLLGAAAVSPRSAAKAPDAARVLLRVWGFLPLVLMATLALLTGAELQMHWGTAFLLFLVPALMESRPRDWAAAPARVVLGVFLALQAVVAALVLVQSPIGPAALRDRHWRQLDAARLAQAVAPARQDLSGPIGVVIGPAAMAGALALGLPEQPLVLIDGRLDISPWVPADLVARCGAVEIGLRADLPNGVPFGAVSPAWSWRVVAPVEPGRCAATGA